MTLIKKLQNIIAAALLVATPAVALGASVTVNAQQRSEQGTQHEQKTQNQNYNYTAQPGDSYAAMARKAVQTYGINNEVNLSLSQIVFAETGLTQTADSPLLNEGQKVTIAEADVKSWVERAQKLNEAQKAAWQAYTLGVNFNTNNVGE